MEGSRLRDLRTSKNMTQEDLGALLGVGKTAISQYESGTRKPDGDMLKGMSKVFGVSVDYLLGLPSRPESHSAHLSTMLPILGTIRAGVPVLAEENWEGEVEVPSSWRADFALRVVGDSMSWAGIGEGDIAALRQNTEAQNGQIVAAGVEDAAWCATLKYFIRENGQPVLRAANPDYDDLPITNKHRIIGTLVGVLKDAPPYQEYRALLTSKAAADRAWSEAIEIATQYGLDGERVAHMIKLFAQVSKTV